MPALSLSETMTRLQGLGSEQTRKTYLRHGAVDPMYGVSFANFTKLRKLIKTDHALALALWGTGNDDAQILATMVADPAQVTGPLAEQWVKDVDWHMMAGLLADLVIQSPVAQAKMEKWMRSRQPWIACTGWAMAATLADRGGLLEDDYWRALIPRIESSIHESPNRVRYCMNMALIAIGARNQGLANAAIAAARRIGPVEVDHGETNCKTPDAESYILKTMAHRQRKAAAHKK